MHIVLGMCGIFNFESPGKMETFPGTSRMLDSIYDVNVAKMIVRGAENWH